MTGVFYDSIMHGKRFLYLLYNITTRTFQTEQRTAHHRQNWQHMFTKQEIKARLQNFSSQDDNDKESAKDCKHNLSPMILKGNHANGIIVNLGNTFTNIHEITNFDYP